MTRFALLLAVMVAATGSAQQTQQRRATIMGGGQGEGKCTVEVVVDGAAEVQVRGDQATLRTLSGRPAEWRRFQCTEPLPSNAGDFRFAAVDGRGRQDLVRDPRQGGSAVVRIEDPQGGAEAYTFDLFWGGGSYGGDRGPERGQGGPGGRFGTAEAVRVCQDAVRDQASQRFGGGRVEFLEGRIDDNPGRNDWVVGRINVGRQGDMAYSCSVDFNSGRVRSASIDPIGGGGGGRGQQERAFENCRRATEDRMRRDGYRRVEFTSMRVDDQRGRNDWVVGTARAYRGQNFDSFEFSCSVNLRDGDVRKVDVRRR
jgi:hypothetical protein